MLPKINRLPRPLFPVVIKQGTKLNSQNITLFYSRANQKNSRFGIIVSSKISKLAVKRNLLKRRLRHALMSALPSLKSSIDAIILSKPTSPIQSTKALSQQLTDAFTRINVSLRA